MMRPNVLIVDDEALARSRLRTLLGDCTEPPVTIAGEAASVQAALALIRRTRVDAVLLDINMPHADGLSFARGLQDMAHPPAVIFVTAHAEHALQAFELAATDYLTKPVRLERLQQALQKIEQIKHVSQRPEADITDEVIVIQERGITVRLPLHEVLYLKAELKYITVRTAHQTHLLEGSLHDLEARYPTFFLRIHRNALVAPQAIRTLEKHLDPVEGECWAVRLTGADELLTVSRRQLAAVKEVISKS